MEKTYIRKIIEHFYRVPFEALTETTIHQVKRSFMDYLGCTIYSAKHDCRRPLVDFICDFSAAGNSTPWGLHRKINGAGAGAANACRTSSLELDDVSGVNASVHPGVYVWSAAIEAWKQHPCDMQTFIKAIVFGYDLCIRMGMLSGESVREFGVHGPGMCGGFAAAATASLILGLTEDEAENAICTVGALLPLCPFISFIEGADSKDMYGGFGVYQALFAAEGAKRGLTGPSRVLEGPKGIKGFFRLERGMDMEPGEEYFIDSISFKEFSACFSVHPAMAAILEMQSKHDIAAEEIESAHVEVYPYSYALSMGTDLGQLNQASARLSVPYCVAFALTEGGLPPAAFEEECLKDHRYLSLAERITIGNHLEYGEGPYGIRGTSIELHMKNGAVYTEEALHSRWNDGPTDEQLKGKFLSLTAGALDAAQQSAMLEHIDRMEEPSHLEAVLEMMAKVEA